MNQVVIEKVRKEIIEFFELNRQTAATQAIWDAFKAYSRGIYIQVSARIRKE